MIRAPFLVTIVVVLIAAVTGVSLVVGMRTGARPEAASAPVTQLTARSGGVAPVPRVEPGPAITVDEAMRRLDLVKPARLKLADNFTLATPDGKRVALGDFRGKMVFVNFWATWCPPCREEMPSMERLYRREKDHGLVILAVSLDSDPKAVSPFVKEHGLTFPVVVDTKMDAANLYGVRAVPSSFMIDRDGYMRGIALGSRAWDGEDAIALVNGMIR